MPGATHATNMSGALRAVTGDPSPCHFTLATLPISGVQLRKCIDVSAIAEQLKKRDRVSHHTLQSVAFNILLVACEFRTAFLVDTAMPSSDLLQQIVGHVCFELNKLGTMVCADQVQVCTICDQFFVYAPARVLDRINTLLAASALQRRSLLPSVICVQRLIPHPRRITDAALDEWSDTLCDTLGRLKAAIQSSGASTAFSFETPRTDPIALCGWLLEYGALYDTCFPGLPGDVDEASGNNLASELLLRASCFITVQPPDASESLTPIPSVCLAFTCPHSCMPHGATDLLQPWIDNLHRWKESHHSATGEPVTAGHGARDPLRGCGESTTISFELKVEDITQQCVVL